MAIKWCNIDKKLHKAISLIIHGLLNSGLSKQIR